MRIFETYVYVPDADGMPFERWHAYMIAIALSSGYHNRFSIGTFEGKSRITVYKNN